MAADCANLSFAGFVDNVGDYLAALDVFILPSNKEGIGGILLDAMLQRVPVIASRVGGLPEIVQDGVNGRLIDPARPDQLKDAILQLRGDDALRQKLGAAGYEIAQNFGPEVMCEKYLRLYNEILQDT